MKYTMEAVDEVRKRAKVGYEAAKEALELSDGNVLDAVIYLEKKGSVDKGLVKNLVEKFKELVNEGFISQIQVFKNGQKIFDIPVVAGVAMIAIWTVPFTAALIFAIASKCDIRIVKRDGASIHISEVTAEKLSGLFHTLKDEISGVKDKWSGKHQCCNSEEENVEEHDGNEDIILDFSHDSDCRFDHDTDHGLDHDGCCCRNHDDSNK